MQTSKAEILLATGYGDTERLLTDWHTATTTYEQSSKPRPSHLDLPQTFLGPSTSSATTDVLSQPFSAPVHKLVMKLSNCLSYNSPILCVITLTFFLILSLLTLTLSLVRVNMGSSIFAGFS